MAVQDRNKHNFPLYAYGICKVFILCEVTGGQFEPNSETTEIAYFALDSLPENLANEKTTAEQIKLCFEAYENPDMPVYFD